MYDTPTTKENLFERAKDQVKKEDPLWGHYVAQKLSALLSIVLWYTPITPHVITLLSLIMGFAAALFFSFGDYSSLIIGAVLLNFSLIFDCADGQIARLKGMSSHVGGWIDYHADKLKDIALLLGFAYGATRIAPEDTSLILVAAFIGIAFQFLRNVSALNRDMYKLQTTGEKDEKRSFIPEEKATSQFMRSVKHTLLFKLADRVLFFSIFAVLNQAALGVFIYAFLEFFYASLSAAINYKMYYQEDKKK